MFHIRLTFFALCVLIIDTSGLYGQSPLLRKKIEYSSSIGKNFILELCDSNLTGRFIGSPRYRENLIGEMFPRPRLDGTLIGTLNNGLWEGYWRDNLYGGKFVVQFNQDYSSYQGAFYRSYPASAVNKWETISGTTLDEVWTLEGKRSPIIAGTASLFASGAGHWYNREYDKANLYSILDVTALGVGAIGSLLFLGDLLRAAATASSLSASTPNGIAVASVALAICGVVRLVAIVDAIASAQRINKELDGQPVPQCMAAFPITPEIQDLDKEYRTTFLAPPQTPDTPPLWRVSRNAVFLELGGAGLYGSLNYEHLVTDWLGLRLGFLSDFRQFTFIPIAANFLIGNNIEHKLEVGVGMSTAFIPDGVPSPFLTGSIGYRYHPALLHGVLFRAVFTPLYGSATQGNIFPWGGISIGYAF
jgi:hypothetical protein